MKPHDAIWSTYDYKGDGDLDFGSSDSTYSPPSHEQTESSRGTTSYQDFFETDSGSGGESSYGDFYDSGSGGESSYGDFYDSGSDYDSGYDSGYDSDFDSGGDSWDSGWDW